MKWEDWGGRRESLKREMSSGKERESETVTEAANKCCHRCAAAATEAMIVPELPSCCWLATHETPARLATSTHVCVCVYIQMVLTRRPSQGR